MPLNISHQIREVLKGRKNCGLKSSPWLTYKCSALHNSLTVLKAGSK